MDRMVKEEELTIHARDGFILAATRRRLEGAAPRATALIAPATAVPAGFYRRFATYLAERGFDTVAFDYRGVGGSRPKSMKGFDARMRDWADLDTVAAVDFAASLNPGKPLLYVGHSFGGQALGLLPNNDKVSRALLVASQVGYWRYVTGAFERYRVYAMLRFIGPVLANTLGYLPAGVGLGDGVPRGVFLEWAGWCMKPGYLFDDETLEERANFPRYRGALRAVGMADDPWATPPAIARLLQGFTGTAPEHITIKPHDVAVSKIGHFNFFRADFRDTLWKQAADWLEAKPA
jgi:predicted alpha/beta hydrolase